MLWINHQRKATVINRRLELYGKQMISVRINLQIGKISNESKIRKRQTNILLCTNIPISRLYPEWQVLSGRSGVQRRMWGLHMQK